MDHSLRPRPVPFRWGVVLVASLLAACSEPTPPSGPNLLFLSIDTLRADHMGVYGYERPTTPRLDAFARGAVVFDSCSASAPWTLPAMASLFTSTYTSTNGCWGYAARLDDSFQTLAEVLLARGYDTACVVSHLFCTTRHGLQQGFVHFDDTFAYPKVDPNRARTAEVIADKGIAFLRAKAAAADGRPWMLWLHFFDPHADYVEAPGFSERFRDPDHDPLQLKVDLYDGEIASTDFQVGRVLDVLGTEGLDDSTIVVVVADHGEEFLEHGGTQHGATLFQEVTRVPLLLRAPGLAACRVSGHMRTVDLMPTLLDLAGVPAPPNLAGQSLLGEWAEGGVATGRPALLETRMSSAAQLEGVTDGSFKLVRTRGGTAALYDLRTDPGETRDVSALHPTEVDRLTETLERLLAEARERGAGFARAPEQALPPSVREQFNGLGYVEEDR